MRAPVRGREGELAFIEERLDSPARREAGSSVSKAPRAAARP
ncbi:hypothetical protein [Streptomyces yanii]|uniref:Uncharacterized protein n=1 Tax=Streptomyces yanii TaxID=78510 RepID=A0ABV5RLS3_9ACTN